MNQQIDLTFVVPEQILDGLKSGVLERIGGVIRDAQTKLVVHWLRDGTVLSGGRNLIVKGVQICKALLAASDFLYMNGQFNDIKSRLRSIEGKIDAQNMAVLQAGFGLAADAERMTDASAARAQLQAARARLLEGAYVYQNLLKERNWGQPKEEEIAMDSLRLCVLGRLAVARTYMIGGEQQLATLHLEAVHGMTSAACLARCKEAFRDPPPPWWAWILFGPFILRRDELLLLLVMKVGNLASGGRWFGRWFADSDKQKIAKWIEKLGAKRGQTDKALDKVLKAANRKKLEIPPSVTEMLALRDFISGYMIENEHAAKPSLLEAV